MVSFDQARNSVQGSVTPLATESVALQTALGRVMGEDIVAICDLVPYARSAMDGYAVRAAETAGATPSKPLKIPVVGKALAEKGDSQLALGSAMAITTGAPLPAGADAVVPFENVTRSGDRIAISARVLPGESVFPPGEDVRCGEVLASCGEMLHAGRLAVLAFAGHARLQVYRRPRVSIVCTGSELVDISETPEHGQIRNSNGIALASLVIESGAEVVSCATAADNRTAIAGALEAARQGNPESPDLILTSGGASAGEKDLVKGVLAELDAQFRFQQVAMRPGKPFAFAIWKDTPICVLPGSPAASFACFHEFVRPALLRLAGRTDVDWPVVPARLLEPLHSKPGREYVVLSCLSLGTGGFEVRPLANQCSALVRTAADANALVVLAGGHGEISTGTFVDVQVLAWPSV